MRRSIVAVFLLTFIFLSSWTFAQGDDGLTRAQTLMDQGQFSEAISVLNKSLSKRRNDVALLNLRALAYTAMANYPKAIDDYEKIIKKEPTNPEAHYDVGMLLAFKTEEGRHALQHLDHYLSLETDTGKAARVAEIMKALDLPIRSKLEQKALTEAAIQIRLDKKRSNITSKLSKLQKLNPNSPVLLFWRGAFYESQGKRDEAIKAYEEALEIRPTSGVSHDALARLYGAKNIQLTEEKHRFKAKLFDAR